MTKICAKASYRKRLDNTREIFTDLNNGNIYYVHELECSVIFSTLSKLIYRFYVIPIRIPANLFFKEIDKLFHNVYKYAKDLWEKLILKMTNKTEELTLFDFMTYCEATKRVE